MRFRGYLTAGRYRLISRQSRKLIEKITIRKKGRKYASTQVNKVVQPR